MPLDPNLAYDLLLLMLQLTEIQEPRLVKKLFCRAVNASQPYLAVRVLAEGESAEGEVFPVATARREFGKVAIAGDVAKAPPELLPMLRTAMRMLALILEDIEQHQLLAAQNQQLEVTVQQRARALRASEERFRTLFEAVSCGILVRDSEGLVRHANPPAATILGLPVEKLRGESIMPPGWRFVRKDGASVAAADLPSSVALREGRSVRDILLGLYAPQFPNVRWLLVNAEPQRDPDTGQINRCVTLFIDITEHIATERRQALATRILQHLNQPGEPMAAIGVILRLIQEHTGADAVGIRLRDGDDYPYYDTSGFSKAFLAHERTLHIPSPAGELILTENGAPLLACLCGCVLQGRTDPALPFFTAGGSFWTNRASEFAASNTWIQCSAAPRDCCAAEGYESVALIPLRSGDEVVGLLHLADRRCDQMTPSRILFFEELGASIGVAIARRRAEDARRRAEETLARYQLLAAHTRDIILFVRCRDGRIVEANEAALQAYGYTREEMLSLALQALRDPETEAPAQVTATQGTLYETRYRRSDGSSFPAEVSSQPMLLDGEEVLLCIVRDISERVRLEAQLRQAQKMEAIGLLAGGIAHDFNNILTPIMAYSDILLSRLPAGDPARHYVDQIAALAERASGLTQQLLAFSRRQVLQPVMLDLNKVLSELEKMLRRLIGENILLDLKLHPELLPVKADTGQMEQVLMNLVVNARDAMPQGGKLSLVTENVVLDEAAAASWEGLRAGKYVKLVARDTGCGMDKETQQHIFEPFYTTKEKGKGTGLGLSTVYGIIAQSGGGIRVDSVVGEGATFTILLPAAEYETAAASSEEAEETTARRGGETILLVEDEPSVQEAVREILKAYGYTVLVAGSGSEAIRVSAEFPGTIHLLLTDVVMPGMNGRDVAHRLAALRPGIRILFISGYTDDAVLVQEVREEDAAFLNKPFLPQVLARKIREVLDVPATRTASDA